MEKLVGKSVSYVDRGNTAIKMALEHAWKKGFRRLYLQDQGGWITYPQFAEKLGFEVIYLETDYGIMPPPPKGAVLVNSMPGYFAYQDMEELNRHCKENGSLLINDASGSIGTKEARYGDIILGSFGRWKPIELGTGGFIAGVEIESLPKPKGLASEIKKLTEKITFFRKTASQIKRQLKDFDIIHKDQQGFNVIVKFSSEGEKMAIIDFCHSYGYEYTLCPRYIRVQEDAVSIEVKRLKFK